MNASKTIFKNNHYTACKMRDGSLIINHKKGGKHLPANIASEWIESIETALDNKEAAFICKAIINSN